MTWVCDSRTIRNPELPLKPAILPRRKENLRTLHTEFT
jgi:hypothetical protein